MKYCLSRLSALILLFGFLSSQVFAYSDDSNKLKITLKVNQESLESIVEQLEKQTGYEIVVDGDEFKNTTISGNYRDVDIDSFFSRVIRDKNIVVLTDNINKSIVVSSIASRGNKARDYSGQDSDNNMAEADAEMRAFLESESAYIEKVQRETLPESESVILQVGVDALTGLPWEEVEADITKTYQQSLNRQANNHSDVSLQTGSGEVDFLKEQSAYASREIEKHNSTGQDKDLESVSVDPLTGLDWNVVEKQMGLL